MGVGGGGVLVKDSIIKILSSYRRYVAAPVIDGFVIVFATLSAFRGVLVSLKTAFLCIRYHITSNNAKTLK